MNIQLNDNNSSKLTLENNKPIIINNNNNPINTTNPANISTNLISKTLLTNNSNLIINGANTTPVSSNINSASATGYYIIQSSSPTAHPNTNMMQIKTQQSNQNQQHQTFQLITNQSQCPSPLQQQTHFYNQNNSTKYITQCGSPVQASASYAFNSPNSSNLSSTRFFIHPSTNNNTNLQPTNNINQHPTVILQNANQLQTNQINNNNTGQIYLNINNRIVPIQSLNIKNSPLSSHNISLQQHQSQDGQRLQFISSNSSNISSSAQLGQQPATTYTTPNVSNEVTNNNNVNNQLSSTAITTTITPVQNQQYLILTNSANKKMPSTQDQVQNASSLSTEITEKMKELELIQNQLKIFQIKLASLTKTDSNANSTSFTQQQIQSVLTPSEQTELQKLIIQRKNVQKEIQQLQEKLLLTPSSAHSISNTVTIQPTVITNNASNNKFQLLQQVTSKINEIKSSKSVINPGNPNEQQLVLTQSEFEQMKKLLELQSQLQNEVNCMNQNNLQKSSIQHIQPQSTTTIKLSELSLADKQKLNELIKIQIQQLKQNLSSNKILNQETTKEKLNALVKKQLEVQLLIDQYNVSVNSSTNITDSCTPNFNIGNNNNNKQTPIKIRNYISSSTNQTSNSDKTISNTPLKTLIFNNNTTNSNSYNINNSNKQLISPNITNDKITSINQSQLNTQELISLENAKILQKQHFPHVQFKCLNFLELAQHSVITKQTSDLTINLIKQLDERASKVINPDQVESFSKNQIKLVNKYLEQQQCFKQIIKNRISEQLSKDHRFVLDPDYKTPFSDKTDAIKRLSRYHVFQKTNFEPSEEETELFNECFSKVSERLLKNADAIKKRFHLFQLRSMQKEVVSSEETMLLKFFVDDLRENFEFEKKYFMQDNTIKINCIDKDQLLFENSSSPSKIMKITDCNQEQYNSNTASEFLNNTLKRSLNYEDVSSSNQSQKKQFHSDSDFKIYENSKASNAFQSSSANDNTTYVSLNTENEKNSFNIKNDSKIMISPLISEFPINDTSTTYSNDKSCFSNSFFTDNVITNDNSHFDDTIDISNSINNLSGLEELILNEQDQFAVQNCLEF
jgi:hypothetical protein